MNEPRIEAPGHFLYVSLVSGMHAMLPVVGSTWHSRIDASVRIFAVASNERSGLSSSKSYTKGS